LTASIIHKLKMENKIEEYIKNACTELGILIVKGPTIRTDTHVAANEAGEKFSEETTYYSYDFEYKGRNFFNEFSADDPLENILMHIKSHILVKM
jgi:hypothetical protein